MCRRLIRRNHENLVQLAEDWNAVVLAIGDYGSQEFTSCMTHLTAVINHSENDVASDSIRQGLDFVRGNKASNSFIKSFSLVSHKLIESAIAKVGNQQAKSASQQHNVHILEELKSWRGPR